MQSDFLWVVFQVLICMLNCTAIPVEIFAFLPKCPSPKSKLFDPLVLSAAHWMVQSDTTVAPDTVTLWLKKWKWRLVRDSGFCHRDKKFLFFQVAGLVLLYMIWEGWKGGGDGDGQGDKLSNEYFLANSNTSAVPVHAMPILEWDIFLACGIATWSFFKLTSSHLTLCYLRFCAIHLPMSEIDTFVG